MARSGSERRGERSSDRDLIFALALASALPCAALLWPGAVPQEIVVLSLVAWAGIFVVALWSVRAEDRRRRQGGATQRASGSTLEPEAGHPPARP